LNEKERTEGVIVKDNAGCRNNKTTIINPNIIPTGYERLPSVTKTPGRNAPFQTPYQRLPCVIKPAFCQAKRAMVHDGKNGEKSIARRRANVIMMRLPTSFSQL
jgi:hypothetical protein